MPCSFRVHFFQMHVCIVQSELHRRDFAFAYRRKRLSKAPSALKPSKPGHSFHEDFLAPPTARSSRHCGADPLPSSLFRQCPTLPQASADLSQEELASKSCDRRVCPRAWQDLCRSPRHAGWFCVHEFADRRICTNHEPHWPFQENSALAKTEPSALRLPFTKLIWACISRAAVETAGD